MSAAFLSMILGIGFAALGATNVQQGAATVAQNQPHVTGGAVDAGR